MTETNLFPSPSEYDEHQELLELMAEDRRRRHLDAQGGARVARPEDYEHFRPRYVLGLGEGTDVHMGSTLPHTPMLLMPVGVSLRIGRLPRTARRSRGRRVARARAYFRSVDRSRTAHRRSARPVIKKGLTR